MATEMKSAGDQTPDIGNDSTIPVYPDLMFVLGGHARKVVQMLAERAVDTAPRILVMMECQDKNRKGERNEQKEEESLAGRILKEDHWQSPQRLSMTSSRTYKKFYCNNISFVNDKISLAHLHFLRSS